MKRLCDFYIRHAGWMGVLLSAVPTLLWFIGVFVYVPFRGVYVLRLVLCLVVGSAIAAYVNRFGVNAWLLKHRSPQGPATVVDGAVVGAAVGLGIALLPTLSIFIRTNHPELAKTTVIITYLAAALAGAVIGVTLAAVARKYVERT